MRTRDLLLACLLLSMGCAHRVDPTPIARLLVLRLADAVETNDEKRADALSVRARGTATSLPTDQDAERRDAAAWLRRAAAGAVSATTEVRLSGALATSVVLSRDADGWRVEPESLGAVTPTLVSAVEHLIIALERMQTDEALHLLSQPLRDTVMRAAAERVRGLRVLLRTVDRDPAGATVRTLTYGHGLRVSFRLENGQWRVDDFN